MRVWNGLLQKEWKLSRKGFWQNLAILFVIWMTSIGAALYWKEPELTVGIGVFLISIHLLYIVGDMFVSLNKEAKSMLWLHNPNSAFPLLSSKLIVSITTCLVSLLSTIALVFISSLLFQIPIGMEWKVGEIFIFLIGLFLASIYLGVWFILFWVSFKSATKSAMGVAMQVLTVILIWPVFHLHLLFYKSYLYEKLLSIGKIPFLTVGSAFENEVFSFGMEIGEFSLALIGFFGLVSFFLMLFSSWCMNKKMEM
ncbi:hypothetical protein [Sutcliffiella halmapala]|uniref:hypothetical protein n=1 Tax=Sutcliffiella halmapala TaxID=79882 RepID=UPI000995D827|nr:hypothetical protein [Sutcliffiella halmapala]